MSAHRTFDTLAFVKRLSESGMAPKQAEALADAIGDLVFETVTTKSDLRQTELLLKNDIGKVELQLKELELRLANGLTARMGAMFAASTAFTVAILGALINLS